MRLLHFFVEERRQTADEKTRQSNRLRDCLKLYFQQILQWFNLDTAVGAEITKAKTQ